MLQMEGRWSARGEDGGGVGVHREGLVVIQEGGREKGRWHHRWSESPPEARGHGVAVSFLSQHGQLCRAGTEWVGCSI